MPNDPKTSPKILLVEDEQIIVDLLERKLQKAGYEVEVARDGQEGLEKMKKNMPDLILLDIVMPKMDGFEVLEKMTEDERVNGTPVVIISNSGQPVELNRAKELGARGWLIKTQFDPQEVLDKVEKHLNS